MGYSAASPMVENREDIFKIHHVVLVGISGAPLDAAPITKDFEDVGEVHIAVPIYVTWTEGFFNISSGEVKPTVFNGVLHRIEVGG